MKVEKMDIKKELIEIPDNRDRIDFCERKPITAYITKENEIPSYVEMTAIKKTYLGRKMTYENDPPKNYLVAIDDKELFQDLIQITDDLFNWAVEKKTNFWREKLIEELDEQKWRIKNLSWWRRLLKRF